MQDLLVLGRDAVPGLLEARDAEVVETAEDGEERVVVLALLAHLGDLYEVLDDARALGQRGLAQYLVDHPEHLLVGELGEARQVGEAVGARPLALVQVVDVLAGLDGAEQAVVAQRELGGHLERIELQEVDLRVAHELVHGARVLQELLGRHVRAQVVARVERQLLGQVVHEVVEEALLDELLVVDADLAESVGGAALLVADVELAESEHDHLLAARLLLHHQVLERLVVLVDLEHVLARPLERRHRRRLAATATVDAVLAVQHVAEVVVTRACVVVDCVVGLQIGRLLVVVVVVGAERRRR